MPRIDDDLLELLRGAVECEGNCARVTQQLDRSTYVRLNRVLEALGGKWVRREKAHVFSSFDGSEGAEASILVADAVTAGEYVDPKQEYQYFPTPAALAERLVEMADFLPGMSVLEPSAGTGSLALAARQAGGSVECVELNPAMADSLEQQGFVVTAADFLQLPVPTAGVLREGGVERLSDERFDRVVMNPPFSRSQDIQHVLRAWEWLKPGGRLAAITGVGWQFRSDRQAAAFRDWISSVPECFDVELLDAGAFRGSGTDVRSLFLVLDK